ncbi:MAG: ABC transporter permease [Oscillospiraceae bacterium]|nr:ABC transporter permease [Oscillospiraceae bacterium]
MPNAYRRFITLPYLAWAGVFIVLPILLIVYYSLTVEADGHLLLSLENYKRAFDPVYLTIFRRSASLSLSCTAICLLLGYPIAYILASREYAHKSFLLFLFLIPMWMNFLLRTYSWISILERNGLINTALRAIGLPTADLLFNNAAVLLGMVYNFLPFMILPICSVLKKREQSLIEAAQDLGANSRQVFTKLIFPLSVPGVVSGITMVFMPATSTFIISDLLGGAQNMLIGNLIEQQFLRVNDWHFGSAVSVILMLVFLASFGIFSAIDKDEGVGLLY